MAAGLCLMAMSARADEGGRYAVTDLVANRAGVSTSATVTLDPNLVNPWGLAFGGGPVWTANNGTASSTLYDGTGKVVPLVVKTPVNPTGLVWNAYGRGFAIPTGNGSATAPASFIWSHEGGEISAWSGALKDPTQAVTTWVNPAAVYKGLAIAATGTAAYLYATDFAGGKVDVYDTSFKPATLACSFRDSELPAGYAPFGIQAIGGDLYVSFALQGPGGHDELHGAGLGRVDVFTAQGCLVRRLEEHSRFDAPWGMALAPASFGRFGGDVLIGNFGSGLITAYDPSSGEFAGYLRDASGQRVAIPGLWALAFGNGFQHQPGNLLYFSAGPNDEADGLYGSIQALPRQP